MKPKIKLKSLLQTIYEFGGPFDLDRVATQVDKLRVATLKLAEAIDEQNLTQQKEDLTQKP